MPNEILTCFALSISTYIFHDSFHNNMCQIYAEQRSDHTFGFPNVDTLSLGLGKPDCRYSARLRYRVRTRFKISSSCS